MPQNPENSESPGAGTTGRRSPLADLPDQILAMLRASPAADLEQHVRALISDAANKMDLVPREEFEIQQALVERLRERVEKLETQLAQRD